LRSVTEGACGQIAVRVTERKFTKLCAVAYGDRMEIYMKVNKKSICLMLVFVLLMSCFFTTVINATGRPDCNDFFYENKKKQNNWCSFYFYNLLSNFGYNSHNTCAYVAIAMLLSYYDCFYNDNIVPMQYEDPPASFEEYSRGSYTYTYGSPGNFYENDLHSLYEDYSEFVAAYSDVSLHLRLLTKGANAPFFFYGERVPNISTDPDNPDDPYARSLNVGQMDEYSFVELGLDEVSYAISEDDMYELLQSYLWGEFSDEFEDFSDYITVKMVCVGDTLESGGIANALWLRNKIRDLVKSNTPVIYLSNTEDEGASLGHASIACDCTDSGSEFYVHQGYHNGLMSEWNRQHRIIDYNSAVASCPVPYGIIWLELSEDFPIIPCYRFQLEDGSFGSGRDAYDEYISHTGG